MPKHFLIKDFTGCTGVVYFLAVCAHDILCIWLWQQNVTKESWAALYDEIMCRTTARCSRRKLKQVYGDQNLGHMFFYHFFIYGRESEKDESWWYIKIIKLNTFFRNLLLIFFQANISSENLKLLSLKFRVGRHQFWMTEIGSELKTHWNLLPYVGVI